MAYTCRRSGLTLKSCPDELAGQPFRLEYFDGDKVVQLFVPCLEDDPSTALAQFLSYVKVFELSQFSQQCGRSWELDGHRSSFLPQFNCYQLFWHAFLESLQEL